MPKETWIAAGVLGTVAIAGIVWFYSARRDVGLERVQAELSEAQSAATRNQAEAEALKQKLAEAQSEIEELKQEQDAAIQMHKSLEDEMRSALESKDVTILQLQGKLTVNILDRLLFDSGEAELKPDGEGVLRKVAAILQQHPELKLHVIGHTDNVPIRVAARSRFASNWELSTARATAAVRFLTDSAGIDPKRLGAVGYGEFRPVADNATAEGRARNRRIAITILPDELAGADTRVTTNRMPAISQAAPSTNSTPRVPAGDTPEHPPQD